MISASADVVDCELGAGAAMLNLQSNIYYSLNEVGAFVWSELARPVDFAQLCRRVEEEFDADPARIEQDLAALVCQLDAAGLVRCVRP